MTLPVHVEYRGPNVSTGITLPGPLLLLPAPLEVVEKRSDRVTLALAAAETSAVGEGADGERPDVFVGAIPLVHLEDDGRTPAITYLWVPPPSPFVDEDIEAMWEEIGSSGCPPPRSVTLQGRFMAGTLDTVALGKAAIEFLHLAHQRCRQLLGRWPVSETYEVVWRDVELRGGREDFPATERSIGSVPALVLDDGRLIPQRTVRRRSIDTPWRSRTLGTAASIVHDALYSESIRRSPGAEAERFAGPFAAVARVATPERSVVDPPVSTWPVLARRCYESLLAVMAASRIEDPEMLLMPLSHLWRLYEAWVAAACLEEVVSRFGEPTDGGPVPRTGCEWMARWRTTDGMTVTLMAQPVISEHGAGPRNDPILPIRSVTSDLVPDALLAVSYQDELRLVAVDAKKRSPSTAMEPAEVAESASKYLWGIRYGPPSPVQEFPVSTAIIASSMPSGTMHSSDSRIRSVRVLPSIGVDDLGDALGAALDAAIADLPWVP